MLGSFRVTRHVRPKLACKCCDTIVYTLAPSRPIARCNIGPGLLAHVITYICPQSFCFGFAIAWSLHRNRGFVGVQLSAREYVASDRAHQRVRQGARCADPVRQQCPFQFNTFAGINLRLPIQRDMVDKLDHQHSASGDTTSAAVWLAYKPDQKVNPPRQLQGCAAGRCVCRFQCVYVDGSIQEAACWAHVRRKFHDLHVARPSAITAKALRRIAEL